MSEHRDRPNADADAVARWAAANDVAYARYESGQMGIAQLIASARYHAERLTNDVFDGAGRFDRLLHGIPDRAGPPRNVDGRERAENGDA